MERAVPSSLLIRAALITGLSVLFGCAHSAPELPPDYGSMNSPVKLKESSFSNQDLALTCADIRHQIVELRNQNAAIKSQIVASRETDQTIGYFSSVLFPPLWLAIDNDEDFKALSDRVVARSDTLLQLGRLKDCKQSNANAALESEFAAQLGELVQRLERGDISADEFLQLRSRVFNNYYPSVRND